jgi:ABC-2 type transport system permease protein
VLVYGARVPSSGQLLAFIVTLLVGAGCFAAIGLAVSGIVPNADAGPPIVNVIIFPILFLSGVFIRIDEGSAAWVLWVGRVFPVKHLVDAMRDSYLGLSFHWSDVLVMAVWMVLAIVVAARTFRWEPSR